ncbi:hypothetical protein V2G26_020030 [Clonostachys chloroleuca]
MHDSKLSYIPALGVDEPPSKRRSKHVFWADAGTGAKHPGKIDISTRPWIFQHGDNSERSSSAEKENMEKGIKPTASTTQRQHIGQAEQIDELWRDRSHIDEAVHSVGKLEDRLQGWNKHQMDAVQETSNAAGESTIRK